MIDHETLLKFCGAADEPRSYIRSPFSLHEYTYATNGHACIRVPRIGRYENAPDHTHNTLKKMDGAIDASIDLTGLRLADFLTTAPCGQCDNGIRYRKTCPECKGECDITFTNDFNTYVVDCESCGADGFVWGNEKDTTPVRCIPCYGSGVAHSYRVTRGDNYVNNALAYLFVAVDPEALIFPPNEVTEDMIAIRVAGGAGVIMPIDMERKFSVA